MAAETATLASSLASSQFLSILLGFLLTLAVLYTLALFVKSIAKLRASNEAHCDAVILCPNCAILYGRCEQRQQEGQKEKKKKNESLANYEYPKPSAGFQKCSACGARFKQKAASGSGNTFYGSNQQHQIIFGKSKDSILVPHWFSDNSSNINSSEQQQQQQHQMQEKERQMGGNHLEGGGEQYSASGAASVGVTTRVLTDEKGHSIKVRIASPPPQRQSQLFKQLQLQQQQQDLQHSAAQRWINGPRDSFASDCPLASLPSLIWDENVGLEPDPEVPPPRPPRKSNGHRRPSRSSSALGHNSNDGSRINNQTSSGGPGSSSPGSSKRRRHSAFSMAGERGGAAAAAAAAEARVGRDSDGHDETSSEFEATKTQLALVTNTTSGSPIEPFNDSNTSEFDDVPGCDSRQDTSLDYLVHLSGNGNGSGNGASPNSNEQVMDADLRQMNRLNLELALLQNAAQQTMRPGGALASGQLKRHGSISSLGSHHHQHLPQSGVLAPVGSQTLPTGGLKSAPLAGGQRAAARRQSSEDADSGCLQDAAEESRRSSGCLSSGERRLSSASTTPTWQQISQQPVASVRIRVRKFSAAPNSSRARQDLAATLAGKRSLLSSLANTIGRSRSTDSGASFQDLSQDFYEISLIEARNINKQAAQANELEARPSLRARRDSLLGALMAAAGGSAQTVGLGQAIGGSPGAQRRSSVEGIFARVFKQQAESAGPAGGDSAGSPTGAHSQTLGRHARLSPVSSCSNSAPFEQAPSSNESQIQLPLLKMSPGQASQELVSFEQLAGRQGYKFTCRLDEFPVRLSLYQISKRNGARLTLGHCILTPADWLASNQNPANATDNSQPQQHFWPQVSKFVHKPIPFGAQAGSPANQISAFETIDEQELPSGGSSLELEADTGSGRDPSGAQNEHTSRAWALDYRLHQTILEAIKAD